MPTKQKASAKKRSKIPTSKRSTLIDNPLLQSTLAPVSRAAASAGPEKEIVKPLRMEAPVSLSPAPVSLSPENEEQANVFEIISDLEKQLDAAFSIKDDQEDEITALKKQLADTEEKAGISDGKVREMEVALLTQREIRSELEFLENERLEVSEKIRSLEKEIKHKAGVIKQQEENIKALTADASAREMRIEQIELEFDSLNKTIRSLQNQITLLEQERQELTDHLESAKNEISNVTDEKERYKKESERTKKSLDAIRVMLAKTRNKARKHYYKKK